MPIREALKKEATYFKSHPLYRRSVGRSVPRSALRRPQRSAGRSVSSHCGTQFLAKKLNKILIHHIRDSLPELKARVNKLLVEAESELAGYGDPLYESAGSRVAPRRRRRRRLGAPLC